MSLKPGFVGQPDSVESLRADLTTLRSRLADAERERDEARAFATEHAAARVNAEAARDGLLFDVNRKEELRQRAIARAESVEARAAEAENALAALVSVLEPMLAPQRVVQADTHEPVTLHIEVFRSERERVLDLLKSLPESAKRVAEVVRLACQIAAHCDHIPDDDLRNPSAVRALGLATEDAELVLATRALPSAREEGK